MYSKAFMMMPLNAIEIYIYIFIENNWETDSGSLLL